MNRPQPEELRSLLRLVLLARLLAEYAATRWGFLTPAQVAEKFSPQAVPEWLDDFRQWMRDYPVMDASCVSTCSLRSPQAEKFTNEIITTLQQVQTRLT